MDRELRTISEARDYFLALCDDVAKFAESGSALAFLPACAILEYLGKLARGSDGKADGFKQFILNWMSQVRPEYANFKFKSGVQDLAVQIYHVLRCGIIHSFSLIPDSMAGTKGGRERSIALCHREAIQRERVTHLGPYSKGAISDAAVLVAEDFVADIRGAAVLLFDKATVDPELEKSVLNWVHLHPPIRGGF